MKIRAVVELLIELLGPPRVSVDARPMSVDTKKAIALLAYLAVTQHAFSRDTLAALFWPEYEQERARASLRRTLSALKKGLGPAQQAVDVAHDQIGFQRADGWNIRIDVDCFNALLAATNRHGHAPTDVCEACLQPLTDAVALYQGDFLAGFSLRDCPEFEEWQRSQSESLRRTLSILLERLATIASRMGLHDAAISAAHRRVSLDPLHEPAHRQLMLAYASAGERSAALQQYRACVLTLDEELGVGPLPETTKLAELIRENRAIPQRSFSTEAPGEKPDARSADHQPPLVGRAAEWQAIMDAYTRAVDYGSLIVLEGEPGVGKTLLAETFISSIRARDAAVITARAYEGESALAYGVIAEALRPALRDAGASEKLECVSDDWLAEAARLLPELALLRQDLPPPVEDQRTAGARLIEGLRRVTVALLHGRAPGLLLLDDVQWADEASLELASHLIRRFRDSPIVVLATWRDEDGPATNRIRQLIADARRSGTATILDIPRLGPGNVVELVDAVVPVAEDTAELAAKLYELTEGLPLFLVACLEALADGTDPFDALPGSMRDLLRARASGVSAAAQQLLGTAAIIGHSFDFATLREASGRAEEEAAIGLEELLARRLVREVEGAVVGDSDRFDFTHEQLRHIVNQDMSLVRRRLLHRRVAEVLRSRLGDGSAADPDPGQIALHYRLAGHDDLAAEFYRRAAERAQRLHANAEAIAHLEAALALGHSDTAELHEALGDLWTLSGAYGLATTSYQLAAARATPERLAVIERKLGSLCVRQGAWEHAEGHFQAALIEDPVDRTERARLFASWSLAAHRQRQLERAWTLAGQALETAIAADDSRALAECHNIVGMLARHRGDLDDAARHLESSLDLATVAGDLGARIAALNNLGLLYATDAQPERGLPLLEDALAVCRILGDRHQEAALLTNIADLLRATGRTAEAVERVKAAVAILADIGADQGSLQPEIWKLSEW